MTYSPSQTLGSVFTRTDEFARLADVTLLAALATGDRATILDLAEELDTFNNLFCPLDQLPAASGRNSKVRRGWRAGT